MSLFKNMLSSGESLFLNPIALDYDYIPKLVPYRENQQHYMAQCIKPLLQERNGKNLLITGTPGIGKTVAVKWVLKDLEENTDNIECIYVNCWKKDTPYKIAVDICEQLGYPWTQTKRTEDLLKEVIKSLNKKTAVIVLDEIDKLQELSIVYTLTEDVYKKSIFLITNDKEWLSKIDQRLKSRLMPETMEFKPYNREETEGILKQRISYAFPKGVISNDTLKIISDKTYEISDIRTGLFLLKESANIAENKGKKKVDLEEAQEAILRLSKGYNSKDVEGDSKEILELIKRLSGKSTQEIYDIYKQSSNISYRSFQRKIKELADLNQIQIEEINKGGKYHIVKYGSVKSLKEF
ncbi:MAG: AAA family ATPase [Candidatus Woesearchaeota archaeon]|nr:MAG: AAA family ATPase [Candidatus Woesearchaeota archaeon]